MGVILLTISVLGRSVPPNSAARDSGASQNQVYQAQLSPLREAGQKTPGRPSTPARELGRRPSVPTEPTVDAEAAPLGWRPFVWDSQTGLEVQDWSLWTRVLGKDSLESWCRTTFVQGRMSFGPELSCSPGCSDVVGAIHPGVSGDWCGPAIELAELDVSTLGLADELILVAPFYVPRAVDFSRYPTGGFHLDPAATLLVSRESGYFGSGQCLELFGERGDVKYHFGGLEGQSQAKLGNVVPGRYKSVLTEIVEDASGVARTILETSSWISVGTQVTNVVLTSLGAVPKANRVQCTILVDPTILGEVASVRMWRLGDGQPVASEFQLNSEVARTLSGPGVYSRTVGVEPGLEGGPQTLRWSADTVPAGAYALSLEPLRWCWLVEVAADTRTIRIDARNSSELSIDVVAADGGQVRIQSWRNLVALGSPSDILEGRPFAGELRSSIRGALAEIHEPMPPVCQQRPKWDFPRASQLNGSLVLTNGRQVTVAESISTDTSTAIVLRVE